jgi:Zinc finger, C3HC4 type (RING finger)
MPPRTRRPKRQKCYSRSNSNSNTNVSEIDLTNDDDSVTNKETSISEESNKEGPEQTVDSQLQKSIHDIGQEFICVCCMDIMIQPTTIVPCGHTFCNQCIFRTINLDKEVCPNCRANIVATVPNRSVSNAIRSIIALQENQLQSSQQSPCAPQQSNNKSRTRSTSGARTTNSRAAVTITNTTATNISQRPFVSFFLPDDVKSFRSREISAPPPRDVKHRRTLPTARLSDSYEDDDISLSLFSNIDYDELMEPDVNDGAEEDDNADRTNAEAAIDEIVGFYQQATRRTTRALRVNGNYQQEAQRRRAYRTDQNNPQERVNGNYQQEAPRRRAYRTDQNNPQERFPRARRTRPFFESSQLSSSSSSSDSSSSDDDDNVQVVSARDRLPRLTARTNPVSTASTNRPPRVRVRSDRVLRSASRTRRVRTRHLEIV